MSKKVTLVFILSFAPSFMSLILCFCASAAPVIPETEIQKWGYKIIPSDEKALPLWDAEYFGKVVVRTQVIKALAQVPHWPGAHFRFTVTQESFESSQDVHQRLEGLSESARRFSFAATKQHPDLILRKGIPCGNHVYIVSTSAIRFFDELPQIVTHLQEYLTATKRCADHPLAEQKNTLHVE